MGRTINLRKSHESTPIWEKSGQVGGNEDDMDDADLLEMQQLDLLEI